MAPRSIANEFRGRPDKDIRELLAYTQWLAARTKSKNRLARYRVRSGGLLAELERRRGLRARGQASDDYPEY